MISSYNMIWGTFYFTRTPMEPPGCKLIVHERPVKLGSWALHGLSRYYILPVMNGYRTYKLYIPKNRVEWSTDMVEFSKFK